MREFISADSISDPLYQHCFISRSQSLPFNVETERVERKTGWEGESEMEEEGGGMSRDRGKKIRGVKI